MTKTEENMRTIALIDAVQSNAGTGLTRGDINRIVDIIRECDHNQLAISLVAQVLHPNPDIDVTAHAGAVVVAVRLFDAADRP